MLVLLTLHVVAQFYLLLLAFSALLLGLLPQQLGFM